MTDTNTLFLKNYSPVNTNTIKEFNTVGIIYLPTNQVLFAVPSDEVIIKNNGVFIKEPYELTFKKSGQQNLTANQLAFKNNIPLTILLSNNEHQEKRIFDNGINEVISLVSFNTEINKVTRNRIFEVEDLNDFSNVVDFCDTVEEPEVQPIGSNEYRISFKEDESIRNIYEKMTREYVKSILQNKKHKEEISKLKNQIQDLEQNKVGSLPF